ncbi:MAG: FAD-dependent oxidoreductase [Sphingobacteriia bacterium]|nr:FAD-dependent oxidoreductase [Sphingobacteriia bacterium]
MNKFNLNFGLSFSDLNENDGLQKIDNLFLEFAENKVSGLREQILNLRDLFLKKQQPEYKEIANFLINISPILEEFLSELFNNKEAIDLIKNKSHALEPIYKCKRNFIQRIVSKSINEFELSLENFANAKEYLNKFINIENDLEFACFVNECLENKEENEEQIKNAIIFAGFKLKNNDNKFNVLFYLPKKLDPNHLIDVDKKINDFEYITSKHLSEEIREGFSLTDQGGDLKFALDQTNYCIFCHNQGKDSCSKGFKEKDGKFKVNSQNVTLTGCPLEEKISEMNSLKNMGYVIAPLSIAMIDNPLLAATGHRICNDCMKACIYQKQEPVDIPQIETKVLRDVLNLPWGVEVYLLLTKWNPLNFERSLPKKDTNKKILVAGMGPAGFNLAHHLLNEGHHIIGIDGLKIEPLDEKLKNEPIYSFEEIKSDLNERIPEGFGGVAEYGITVRWDKNFLNLIRIILERRKNFELYGGVRFGSNLNLEQAKELGFNHVALAIGAGKPNLIEVPNSLVRGVRTASDFLMQLQSGGAFLKSSIANLQIRFPVAVIGGGLTAIDTASETLAYYPKMLEKFFYRYRDLQKTFGKEILLDSLTEEEKEILDEYTSHYALLKNKTPHEQIKIMNDLGGVSVIYRKSLQDSPAYRLNHEEVLLALEEGIRFVENSIPKEVITDKHNHLSSLKFEQNSEIKEIKIKTLFIAAGTHPNTTIAKEYPEDFKLDGKYFVSVDENNNRVVPERISKPEETFVLTHVENNFSVSFLGDMHPSFAGNVVKAMASSKRSYPIISDLVNSYSSNLENKFIFKEQFTSVVHEVNVLAPKIVEVVVKSPMAAKNFEPGQFYKLQNFATNSLKNNGTLLAMEGLALTGASVDKEKGLLSTIVLEMGGSSDLCKFLKPGEEIVLMGPTGTATEIPHNKTVMLVGGGLGNAVLFSIGQAMRKNGCKVLYFAGYRNLHDRYKIEEIEKASDKIIWACDEGMLPVTRDADYSFNKNIIESVIEYSKIPNLDIKLSDIEHIIVIGSDRMMGAFAKSLSNELKEPLLNAKIKIASINSPMQCMMKEICAQCLQEHIDPITKEKYYVYSCVNQDQDLEKVNFEFLNQRLKQNTLQEKLTAKWIDYNLKQMNKR